MAFWWVGIEHITPLALAASSSPQRVAITINPHSQSSGVSKGPEMVPDRAG
jgi:hypothetical protein